MDNEMELRRIFLDPKLVNSVWCVFDGSGWLRGSANTRELASKLKADAEAGKIATPILNPPHYA